MEAAAAAAAKQQQQQPIQQSNRQWTRVKNETTSAAHLQVSNANVCLPDGEIEFRCDFCDETTRQQILEEIHKQDFVKKGFDRRIRTQKYSLVDNDEETTTSCPESLRKLALQVQESIVLHQAAATTTRTESESSLPPTHIVIEEHQLTPWSFSGDYAPHQIVSTFEVRTPQLRGNENGDKDSAADTADTADTATADTTTSNDYFVALLALQNGVIHHMNKPKERQEMMWTLESPDQHTNIHLAAGSLLVKRGQVLDSWRCSTTAAPVDDNDHAMSKSNNSNNDGKNGVAKNDKSAASSSSSILVKFVRLPVAEVNAHEEKREANFGYVAGTEEDDRIPRTGDLPPLDELLTIIVTTSPIKSHPSTELLERTFGTFYLAGAQFLTCQKVIVCDGFRKQEDGKKVSKKHNNSKQAMRNGIVTEDQAINYTVFKERLQTLCATADADSPFWNTRVEELSERMGYGFALRHALRHCVSTPFVCVIQHDRAFMRPTPMYNVVQTMWWHWNIKYVGINMRSNLMYRDIFLAKYGKASEEEMRTMVLRPPELLLDANKYGPRGECIDGLVNVDQSVLKNIKAVATAYQTSSQCLEELEYVKKHPPPEGKHQLTLTPTLFWYDNTHVCDTAHYRDFVFNPRYKMVARGGFVEDKLSPVMKRTVERLGLKDGHSRFGCFILDDHSGLYFTGHLDGGAYIPTNLKAALAHAS